MTPADLILAFLGRGPCTKGAMVGLLLGRRYPYDAAVGEVNQAILALTRAGRIESFSDECFRLTAKFAQTEKLTKTPTNNTVNTGGNRQSGQDRIPAFGVSEDGE